MSLILDSTCGYRKMWQGKDIDNTIFIDIRSEVKPIIVCDLTQSPFKDNTFDIIYFDPPHHVPAKNFWGNHLYGEGLSPSDRVSLFLKANKEFSRILREDGHLICKTTRMPKNKGFNSKFMDLSLEQCLSNFKLENKVELQSRGYSKNAKVHWSKFRKL